MDTEGIQKNIILGESGTVCVLWFSLGFNGPFAPECTFPVLSFHSAPLLHHVSFQYRRRAKSLRPLLHLGPAGADFVAVDGKTIFHHCFRPGFLYIPDGGGKPAAFVGSERDDSHALWDALVFVWMPI